MCLANLVLNTEPERPDLPWSWIVIANRDELHARPSRDMQPWPDQPDILGGQDLEAGGTWLAVHRDGRLGLLTNYREPGKKMADAPSRGHLVEGYLTQKGSAGQYLQGIEKNAYLYNGFNLLLGDPATGWWHASNRTTPFAREIRHNDHASSVVRNGIEIIGLSNAVLGTPWPKLLRTTAGVFAALQSGSGQDLTALMHSLVRVFQDRTPADDSELPQTGLSLERERLVSAPFILDGSYGTRCTTVAMQLKSGTMFVMEITYRPDGSARSQSLWESKDHGPWQPIQNQGSTRSGRELGFHQL